MFDITAGQRLGLALMAQLVFVREFVCMIVAVVLLIVAHELLLLFVAHYFSSLTTCAAQW
jgi:hypothetical protein